MFLVIFWLSESWLAACGTVTRFPAARTGSARGVSEVVECAGSRASLASVRGRGCARGTRGWRWESLFNFFLVFFGYPRVVVAVCLRFPAAFAREVHAAVAFSLSFFLGCSRVVARASLWRVCVPLQQVGETLLSTCDTRV